MVAMLRTPVLLVGLLVTLSESALDLPSYIKPCSRNDPNLDECALKSGIAAIPFLIPGDPMYKVPVLKPLSIPEIRLGDPEKGNKPTGLNIVMRDLQIHGLDRAVLKKTKFDLKKKEIELMVDAPELRLVFQYEIDGKILVLPLKGSGSGSINMTDVTLVGKLNYGLVTKKDGLEYMEIKMFTLTHTTTLFKLRLDNLFNGDKTLGKTTNDFLNENWREVNAELAPPIVQAIGQVIKIILANWMELVPYNNVFPEKV